MVQYMANGTHYAVFCICLKIEYHHISKDWILLLLPYTQSHLDDHLFNWTLKSNKGIVLLFFLQIQVLLM